MRRHELAVGKIWQDINKDDRTVEILEVIEESSKAIVRGIENGRKSKLDMAAFGGWLMIKPRFVWICDRREVTE